MELVVEEDEEEEEDDDDEPATLSVLDPATAVVWVVEVVLAELELDAEVEVVEV